MTIMNHTANSYKIYPSSTEPHPRYDIIIIHDLQSKFLALKGFSSALYAIIINMSKWILLKESKIINIDQSYCLEALITRY